MFNGLPEAPCPAREVWHTAEPADDSGTKHTTVVASELTPQGLELRLFIGRLQILARSTSTLHFGSQSLSDPRIALGHTVHADVFISGWVWRDLAQTTLARWPCLSLCMYRLPSPNEN